MGTGVLRAILGFGIVSTGLHFTHNFVRVEDYPSGTISDGAVQAAILLTWPLFTAIAIHAGRLYGRGEQGRARGWLTAYALFTLVSLGHFTQAGLDLPPFWYATIFTDVLAGLLLLGFLLVTSRARVGAT